MSSPTTPPRPRSLVYVHLPEAGETNNWCSSGRSILPTPRQGSFASGSMWAIRTTVAWQRDVHRHLGHLDCAEGACFQEFSGVLAGPQHGRERTTRPPPRRHRLLRPVRPRSSVTSPSGSSSGRTSPPTKLATPTRRRVVECGRWSGIHRRQRRHQQLRHRPVQDPDSGNAPDVQQLGGDDGGQRCHRCDPPGGTGTLAISQAAYQFFDEQGPSPVQPPSER